MRGIIRVDDNPRIRSIANNKFIAVACSNAKNIERFNMYYRATLGYTEASFEALKGIKELNFLDVDEKWCDNRFVKVFKKK